MTDCSACIATSCPGCACPACVLGPAPVDVVQAPDGSVIPMDHGFNMWTGFYNTAWAPLVLGLAGVYAVAAIGGAIQRSQRRAGGGRVVNGERFAPGYSQRAAAYEQATRGTTGASVTVSLSQSGARILKMLGPRPWEGGGPEWNGNRATVDKHSIELLLVQSGPGVGFPAGDRKRLVAAAGQLGIHADDRGRYRAEQFRAGGGYVAFTRPRDGKERIIGPFRTPALAERERAAWAGSVSDYGPYRHLRIIPSGPEARRLLAEQSARARELAHHHAR